MERGKFDIWDRCRRFGCRCLRFRRHLNGFARRKVLRQIRRRILRLLHGSVNGRNRLRFDVIVLRRIQEFVRQGLWLHQIAHRSHRHRLNLWIALAVRATVTGRHPRPQIVSIRLTPGTGSPILKACIPFIARFIAMPGNIQRSGNVAGRKQRRAAVAPSQDIVVAGLPAFAVRRRTADGSRVVLLPRLLSSDLLSCFVLQIRERSATRAERGDGCQQQKAVPVRLNRHLTTPSRDETYVRFRRSCAEPQFQPLQSTWMRARIAERPTQCSKKAQSCHPIRQAQPSQPARLEPQSKSVRQQTVSLAIPEDFPFFSMKPPTRAGRMWLAWETHKTVPASGLKVSGNDDGTWVTPDTEKPPSGAIVATRHRTCSLVYR